MPIKATSGVPEAFCRVINDAWYEHHPFKSGSSSLRGFIGIANALRESRPDILLNCVLEIESILAAQRQQNDCIGCYGKGLAYLLYITRELIPGRHGALLDQYRRFMSSRDWGRDFREELSVAFASTNVPMELDRDKLAT